MVDSKACVPITLSRPLSLKSSNPSSVKTRIPTVAEKAATRSSSRWGIPSATATSAQQWPPYVFLDLNGYEFLQTDEQIEEMIVSLAAGTVDQGEFFGWVVNHARRARSLPS